MSTISIKNLSFAYNGQDLLFDNVSLSLDSQWKLGLLGRNGRGKTTLLNIIQGKLDYSGKISANIDFEYFPQVISDKENLTLYAIQDKFHVEQWELEKEFSQLQLDPKVLWQPFNTLSGGEQTKVLLALAFKNKNSFVLLDEPTNHLDAHTRQQVATYLNNKKQGFIITSHDRDFLNQVIDHTLVIEAQNIRLQQGDYARYEEQKAIEDKSNLAQNEKLKRSISQLKTSAAQKKNWARSAEREKENNSHADKGFITAKAARVMKRSTTMQKRIESQIKDKEGLLTNIETITPLSINFQTSHHQDILNVEKLTLAYPGYNSLFKPISFNLKQGQQVVLKGDNGSGKSSLIRAILKQDDIKIIDGNISLASNLKISYLQQLEDNNTDNLKQFAEHHHLEYNELLNILHKLGVERNTFTNRICDLSAGQKKKVFLAKSLLEPANLYLWDEPLNYLDTFNQDQIIELIKTYRPTMLIIEHDSRFIDEIDAEVVELQKL